LYTAVGENHVSARHVVNRLVSSLGGIDDAAEEIAERSTLSTMPSRTRVGGDAGVVVEGIDNILIKLAKCCTPVPGDDILGFITRGGGV
ncbi:bifunctional (p)ppGpp synthetase/guanosine-3',5'-bis(diphosphate) 3'-pyrophosphohydrolase, partial [Mycobacterium tuberculosis]|nr:bifunctional (p)ppGpp synthetase/guanosine-3',5'-bis(diphosphate) 3'-pyrophosphohydrolase [Mycobacterium tuberculosis]